MTVAPPRPSGLSIFKRTFLLLVAALALALAVAVALLVLAPIRGSAELTQVVALLSSRVPATDGGLHGRDSELEPELPAGFVRRSEAETSIARWLDVDAGRVRYASTRELRGRGRGPGPPPPGDACGEDCARPPPHAGDEGPQHGGPPLAPDTLLRGDFIAALRHDDGRWRVVESSARQMLAGLLGRVLLLFVAALLLLLPVAWWFSRALSAPIREFARAADHLGRNPQADPLPLHGPQEIARAAESFNTMQTRLNRMVAERTQMLGAIAHDLRTPLARLAFRLDKLPSPDQEKAQSDIDEMKAMIAAALELLRDQSRSGQRGPLDLRSLVEGVVEGLADTGHEVALEPGASATVNGDPVALRRMVTNLVDNALKYGRRAQLRLLVAGSECRLEVDDDGPGIDPAQKERLFMPFFRGEASRNRGTGGIGLGLSVVQDIAVGHGGQVLLENRPGGGLRATVVLPTL